MTTLATRSVRTALLALAAAASGACVKHWKAPLAPPEIAAGVQMPEWKKEGTTVLEGTTLKALQIAMHDFLPPGTKLPKDADAVSVCLHKWETFDAWVRRGDKVTFIYFTPKEDERCGIDRTIMDPGAAYAVSDEGVILRRD